MRIFRATILMTVLIVSACSSVPEKHEGEVDWEHPLVNGTKVASLAEARRMVAFRLVEPKWQTTPKLIEVEQADIKVRSIALVYSLPEEGTVLVREMPPSLTEETLRKRATANDSLKGGFALTTVRGHTGLLVTGQATSRLTWLEDGVQFDLMGPNLPPQAAAKLAATL